MPDAEVHSAVYRCDVVVKGGAGREARIAREREARQRRTANAAARAEARRPVTESSVRLGAALRAEGLLGLAERARRLEFDDLFAPSGMGLPLLVEELLRCGGHEGLVDRVAGGEFDASPADWELYDVTPAGRQLMAELEGMRAAHPELEAMAERVFEHLGDPRVQARLTKETVAKLAERIGAGVSGAPGVGDDRVVTADEVPAALHYLLDARGPHGERLDTPEILATADLAGRTGAVNFKVRCDDAGAKWSAAAMYRGGLRVMVDGLPGPAGAAHAFARRLLQGGRCQHCGRIVAVAGSSSGVRATDRMLLYPDGVRPWSQAEQASSARESGPCVWARHDLRWVPGCEEPGG